MNNLANSYYDLGRYAEALKLYEETLELRRAKLGADDPDTLVSMHNLAINYYALGRHAEALKLCQETLQLQRAKLRPDDPDTLRSMDFLAWQLATCPETKSRDAVRAVSLARKAVELAPSEGGFWRTLGAAHYRSGDWKAAVEALEKSTDLRKGGDSSDWLYLAMAHWQLGDKDRARKWFDQAVEWMDKNQPKNQELRRFRNEAAELMGIDGAKK